MTLSGISYKGELKICSLEMERWFRLFLRNTLQRFKRKSIRVYLSLVTSTSTTRWSACFEWAGSFCQYKLGGLRWIYIVSPFYRRNRGGSAHTFLENTFDENVGLIKIPDSDREDTHYVSTNRLKTNDMDKSDGLPGLQEGGPHWVRWGG